MGSWRSGSAAALDGVAAAEPIAEVPVELSVDGQSHVTLLQGLPADGELLQVFTPGGERLRPGDGILITSALAKLLGVGKGDTLTVRPLVTAASPVELAIDDIVQQPLGDIIFALCGVSAAALGLSLALGPWAPPCWSPSTASRPRPWSRGCTICPAPPVSTSRRSCGTTSTS